jgi:hypothetical protein
LAGTQCDSAVTVRKGSDVTGMVAHERRRTIRHESDVLIRQLDGQLATLRASRSANVDLALAGRLADTLRVLVADTTYASAADRARVRAAVHFFVMRWDLRHARRPARPLSEDVRVVNEIVSDLGRYDLLVTHEALVAAL